MISSKVKKLWERAIKDDDFLDMLRKADNDEKPPNNSDDKIKAIFASIYYGWLIAKYGGDWERPVTGKICVRCGKREGELSVNPYAEEVTGERKFEILCGYCLQELVDAV